MTSRKVMESVIATGVVSFVAVIGIVWAISYSHSWFMGQRSWNYAGQEMTDQSIGLFFYRGMIGAGVHRSHHIFSQRPGPDYRDSKFGLEANYSGRAPWSTGLKPWQSGSIITLAGFQWINSNQGPPGWQSHDKALMLPCWFLILLVAVPGARWMFWRERKIHRVKFGKCKGCGYDLRESRERCPECGAVIVSEEIA